MFVLRVLVLYTSELNLMKRTIPKIKSQNSKLRVVFVIECKSKLRESIVFYMLGLDVPVSTYSE
jgi:ribosomal protein L30E